MPARSTSRQSLIHGEIEWVHLSRNLPQDVEYLGRRYGFHALDLRDSLPPLQRHKLVQRDHYAFLILLFPIFDRKSRIVSSVEIDFFITPHLLVSINGGTLPLVQRFFEECTKDPALRERVFKDGSMGVLSHLLSRLLESIYPMLLHLSSDVDTIETDLFKSNQRFVIMEILRIKTNIVNVRKSMQGHKKVLQSLLRTAPEISLPIHKNEYFEALIEHTKEIWDNVELQRDTINALQETHVSLIDSKTNDVLTTLTMFSVIIFPMTLVAAIFAVDTASLPWRDDPFGFLKILGMIGLIPFLMMLYFKRREWL